MNGLAKRRSRSWAKQRFAGLRKFEPQSMMPPYWLSPSDLRNLTAYLLGLLELFTGMCIGSNAVLAETMSWHRV
jgi:hypothetical protein